MVTENLFQELAPLSAYLYYCVTGSFIRNAVGSERTTYRRCFFDSHIVSSEPHLKQKAMQRSNIDETMNFQINTFDAMEAGTTFIGTEIFPAVLHSMLDEVEEKGFSNIVSWQPHGRWYDKTAPVDVK